eukprot:scpid99203/ scgid4359/ 
MKKRLSEAGTEAEMEDDNTHPHQIQSQRIQHRQNSEGGTSKTDVQTSSSCATNENPLDPLSCGASSNSQEYASRRLQDSLYYDVASVALAAGNPSLHETNLTVPSIHAEPGCPQSAPVPNADHAGHARCSMDISDMEEENAAGEHYQLVNESSNNLEGLIYDVWSSSILPCLDVRSIF